MGKIGKPQRSKKQKKIKAVDPFYNGVRKDVRSKDHNQTPKTFNQEIPRKLKQLGNFIDDSKSGKRSKNKFLSPQQGSVKFNSKLTSPLGAKSADTPTTNFVQSQKKKSKDRTPKQHSVDPTLQQIGDGDEKKKKKPKFKKEDVEDYIDNLKPSRPFVEDFQFKRNVNESAAKFMRRVDQETQLVLAKSKIDEQYEETDEKKIEKLAKAKKSKLSEKKKQRQAEKKKLKLEVLKEKKKEKQMDFNALQDKVEFGDVVHAPPVLTFRPKKASKTDGHDKPALRMPELKEAIEKNIAESIKVTQQRQRGQTIKRKALSSGLQIIADARRNEFIDAYREMKAKRSKLKSAL